MENAQIKTADISISIAMRREWVCEQYTKWSYTSRVISNEFGEVLGSFSGNSLTTIINQAVEKSQEYITGDKAIQISLKRDDCEGIKSNNAWCQVSVWCQVNVFDYAKAQRVANRILSFTRE